MAKVFGIHEIELRPGPVRGDGRKIAQPGERQAGAVPERQVPGDGWQQQRRCPERQLAIEVDPDDAHLLEPIERLG